MLVSDLKFEDPPAHTPTHTHTHDLRIIRPLPALTNNPQWRCLMLVATIKESPTFRNYGCGKLPMMSVMKLCVCVCVYVCMCVEVYVCMKWMHLRRMYSISPGHSSPPTYSQHHNAIETRHHKNKISRYTQTTSFIENFQNSSNHNVLFPWKRIYWNEFCVLVLAWFCPKIIPRNIFTSSIITGPS
jgi:hypothetical protein